MPAASEGSAASARRYAASASTTSCAQRHVAAQQLARGGLAPGLDELRQPRGRRVEIFRSRELERGQLERRVVELRVGRERRREVALGLAASRAVASASWPSESSRRAASPAFP